MALTFKAKKTSGPPLTPPPLKPNFSYSVFHLRKSSILSVSHLPCTQFPGTSFSHQPHEQDQLALSSEYIPEVIYSVATLVQATIPTWILVTASYLVSLLLLLPPVF